MIRFDKKALRRAALVKALRACPQFLFQMAEVSNQLDALLQQIAEDAGEALALLQPAAGGRVITVVNKGTTVKDADFQEAVAAVQQQVSTDFAQAWNLDGVTVQAGQDTAGERIYLLDNSAQAGVLGYHTEDAGLVPVGYVFAGDTVAAGGDWAATLSHEALEQIVDPWTVGLMVLPLQGQTVAVAYEVADPVENDVYTVAGRQVSNFVWPSWFNPGYAGQVDQLGRLQAAGTLSAGGYVAFTPDLQTWQQVFGDKAPPAVRLIAPLSRRARRFRRALRKLAVPAAVKK